MTDQRKYMSLLAACVVCCIGGVGVAVLLADDTHGGRGGALGVALSFYALFVSARGRYNTVDFFDKATTDLLKLFEEEKSVDDQVDRNTRRINLLKRDLERSQQTAMKENIYLAASSGISTLFWGFGDLLAKLIIAVI